MKTTTLLLTTIACLSGGGIALAETTLSGDYRINGYLRGGGASTSTSLTTTSIAYGSGAWSGGLSSAAFGYNARTYAHYGAAFGIETESKSYNCFVIGRYNISAGYTANNYVDTEPAFTIGDGISHAVRSDAFKILKNGDIFGYGRFSLSPDTAENSITGSGSVGMGSDLTITGAYQTVLGRYNVQGAYDTSGWTSTDPLLVLANGSSTQPSNALVVLKNGNTGIGTSTPSYKLDVDGGVRVKNGAVLVQPQGDLSMGSYTSGPQP